MSLPRPRIALAIQACAHRTGSNTSEVTHAIGDQQVMCQLAIRASAVSLSRIKWHWVQRRRQRLHRHLIPRSRRSAHNPRSSLRNQREELPSRIIQDRARASIHSRVGLVGSVETVVLQRHRQAARSVLTRWRSLAQPGKIAHADASSIIDLLGTFCRPANVEIVSEIR